MTTQNPNGTHGEPQEDRKHTITLTQEQARIVYDEVRYLLGSALLKHAALIEELPPEGGRDSKWFVKHGESSLMDPYLWTMERLEEQRDAATVTYWDFESNLRRVAASLVHQRYDPGAEEPEQSHAVGVAIFAQLTEENSWTG